MTRSLLCLSVCLVASSCVNQNDKIAQLTDENATLKTENQELREQLKGAGVKPPTLRTVPSFTVGLAASESGFDAAAFEKLLRESLDTATDKKAVRVTRESNERQVQKVRGMLLQQYLAAEQIPIVITNLSFKLRNRERTFKIGGEIVPRNGIKFTEAAGATVALHKNALQASMRRDAQGRYSIPYGELQGGSGTIQIQTSDAEVLDTQQKPRAQRQGDISFNWNLNLEKVQVYRVQGFAGDMGAFLSNMRYLGVQSSIGQYQTMRDVVCLFGYGSYVTSVVNQIRTPAHTTTVDVLAIDKETFDKLDGRMTESEVLEILGKNAAWRRCKLSGFRNAEKTWERPTDVAIPFVSRQISEGENRTFYLKFDSAGPRIIGDYER